MIAAQWCEKHWQYLIASEFDLLSVLFTDCSELNACLQMARGKYKGPKRGSGQKNRERTEEEEEEIFRRQGKHFKPTWFDKSCRSIQLLFPVLGDQLQPLLPYL